MVAAFDCDDVVQHDGFEAIYGSPAGDDLLEARMWDTDVDFERDMDVRFNAAFAMYDAQRHGAWPVGSGGDCDGDVGEPFTGKRPWTESDNDGRSCPHGIGMWCGEDCPQCYGDFYIKPIPPDDKDCDGPHAYRKAVSSRSSDVRRI